MGQYGSWAKTAFAWGVGIGQLQFTHLTGISMFWKYSLKSNSAKWTRTISCFAILVGLACLFDIAGLSAQTVQLPTFGVFSYRGAVSVPDGGTIQAGSVKRSAEGSVSNGIPLLGGLPGINRGFGNRAIGRETSSSGLTIKPTILIMSELEEDHLAAAGYGVDGNTQGSADAVIAKAAFLSKNVGRNDQSSGNDSHLNGPPKR